MEKSSSFPDLKKKIAYVFYWEKEGEREWK